MENIVWIVALKGQFVGAYTYEHNAVDAKERLQRKDPQETFDVFWTVVKGK